MVKKATKSKARKGQQQNEGPKRPLIYDGGSAAAKFRAAMLSPFSKTAIGAQIPDTYCAPTATYHIKNRFTVTTAADGTADLVLLPNGCLHAVCCNGTVSSGIAGTFRDNTAYANSCVLTNTNSLSGKLANYRIVAMGVRIKAITSMTDSKGSVVMGVIPMETISPLKQPVGGVTPATDASQTLEAWYLQNGIPYTGAGATAVIDAGGVDNLPIATSMSILQLAERPVEIRFKPTTAAWTMFRSTTDRQFGFDTVNQAAPVDCGDGSYLRIGGMETGIIKFHGCAASTAVSEVEIMYHLEGTPAITGGASYQLAAGGGNVAWVSMSTMDSVLQAVTRASTFAASAANGVLDAASAVGRVAGALGGYRAAAIGYV